MLEWTTVLYKNHRHAAEPLLYGRIAVFERGQGDVKPYQGQNHQEPVRHGVIVRDHRVLSRFTQNEQQDKVEGRHLHKGSPTGDSKDDHEKYIDGYGPQNGI